MLLQLHHIAWLSKIRRRTSTLDGPEHPAEASKRWRNYIGLVQARGRRPKAISEASQPWCELARTHIPRIVPTKLHSSWTLILACSQELRNALHVFRLRCHSCDHGQRVCCVRDEQGALSMQVSIQQLRELMQQYIDTSIWYFSFSIAIRPSLGTSDLLTRFQ